jgi:hypothetical protein
LGCPRKRGIFTLPLFQFVLFDGLPDQRGRSTVSSQQIERNRRLPVAIELSPIKRDAQRFPGPDHERHPPREERPHGDGRVAQQPVHLLDAMFGVGSLGDG